MIVATLPFQRLVQNQKVPNFVCTFDEGEDSSFYVRTSSFLKTNINHQ